MHLKYIIYLILFSFISQVQAGAIVSTIKNCQDWGSLVEEQELFPWQDLPEHIQFHVEGYLNRLDIQNLSLANRSIFEHCNKYIQQVFFENAVDKQKARKSFPILKEKVGSLIKTMFFTPFFNQSLTGYACFLGTLQFQFQYCNVIKRIIDIPENTVSYEKLYSLCRFLELKKLPPIFIPE